LCQKLGLLTIYQLVQTLGVPLGQKTGEFYKAEEIPLTGVINGGIV